MNYGKVDGKIIAELVNICKDKKYVICDNTALEQYSRDEISDPSYAAMPEIVVKPGTTLEISEILKLANKYLIPITPRGAGSGLSGGAVPIHGGIVISTERLNRIIEIDRENLIAVLEPGVVTNDFNIIAQKDGLFFAGYPMSIEMCFIGGNVAENAGGGRALKYGVTGRYITGLEVVMPSGDICLFGGKRVKDVTGYNMIQLLVGSEGTLGIFTKIYIKLMPLPKEKIDMLVLFDDAQSAINIVPEIITKLGILPTGIEFMDKMSYETTCEYLGEIKRHQDYGATLIIEIDGNDADQVREDCLRIGELCLDNGAADAFIAEGPSDQEKIWRVRKHVAEAFKAISPIQSLEDIVVPVSNIPKLLPELEELSCKYDVLLPCYGHAGDGNLHVTVVKKPEVSLEVWESSYRSILRDLYIIAQDLGGTISGEHGIGHKRKEFLPQVLGKSEIDVMINIKRALDPNNILNPGKIFDID